MSLSISSSFASAINYGDLGALYQGGGYDPANEVGQADDSNDAASTASAPAATGTAALAQAGAVGGGNILAQGVDPNAASDSIDANPPPPPQASGRGQLVDLSV